MRKFLFLAAFLAVSAVSAAVTLDPLTPGKNYEALTVSGTAEAGASLTVKLIDRIKGAEAGSKEVTADGTGRFSAEFASLAAGGEYTVLVDGAECGTVVMARERGDGWVAENADTVSGSAPGTGVWTADEGGLTARDGRICITSTEDEGSQAVVYTPTNNLGEAIGYWVTMADTVFKSELADSSLPEPTDEIFGITLVIDPEDNSRSVLYIIDGRSWKNTGFVADFETSYDLRIFVDERNRRVSYHAVTGGVSRYLGSGAISEDGDTRLRQFDFEGDGAFTSLRCEACDTGLVSAEVHFDNAEGDRFVTPGTNFTNLNLTGWVAVTNLWDTDVASGKIRFYVIDSQGATNGFFTAEWDGFSDYVYFTNRVDGLTAGAEYRIEVHTEVDDETHREQVLGDEYEAAARMARRLDGVWFDENGDTATGAAVGYGVWSTAYDEVSISNSAAGGILIVNESEESASCVNFIPTNPTPRAVSATVFRTRVAFDAAGDFDVNALPDASAYRYGFTMVWDDDGEPAIAVSTVQHGWNRVERSVFAPEIGREYEFEVYADEISGGRSITFHVLDDDGVPVMLASFDIAGSTRVRPESFDIYGNADFSEFLGECYDTSLLKAVINLDGTNVDVFAGRNFTNLLVNGFISVTNLWETDLTGGKVVVTITGSDGVPHEIVSTNWTGFTEACVISNLVDSLVIGESYTIDIRVTTEDGSDAGIITDESWIYRGVTGRRLDDLWYDEDYDTYFGGRPSTGEWSVYDGMTVTADSVRRLIMISDDGSSSEARLVFTPTNPVPRNAQVSLNAFQTRFDDAVDFYVLPDVSDELFGITLAASEGDPFFVVVDDGKWKTVDRSTFAPELGTEYFLEVLAEANDDGRCLEYFVTDLSGNTVLIHRGTFPEAAEAYPADLVFRGEGGFAIAEGALYDTSHYDVDFQVESMPGTNFTAAAVNGRVVITPLWDTDLTNGTIRVTIRNGSGEVVSSAVTEFHGTSPVELSVDGLEPGDAYTVDIEIIDADGNAGGEAEIEGMLTPTAKRYDGRWIYETSRTFAGDEVGTGDWSYRKLQAVVTADSPIGEAVRIQSDLSASVIFNPTNEDDTVINSTVREIVFDLCSEVPGFNVSAPEYAKSRPADLAGITIACDDMNGGALHFAVYNPEGEGSWEVLSGTSPVLNKLYRITVVITYPNPNLTRPGSIGYYLGDGDGGRKCIAFFEPEGVIPEITDNYKTRLRFSGSGYVGKVEGSCYDAHLASVDGVEFWTIADAIHEIGTSGRYLVPLWYSTYTADMNEGYFGVKDDHVPPYLTINWPLGYVVEITAKGEIKYYLFRLSDYWIDWAVAEDAEEIVSGKWSIKSANGLAWLARESTNRWISGEIELASDITNLYEHIWTPIQGFTGTFDGAGKTITGLTDKGVGVNWTNALDLSVYGLFGTASNSVFRNVAFEEVAITNSADAIASLLGCSIGDLALTNVVVRSGDITGGGRFVSGIVGYIGDFGQVDLVRNFNAASLALTNAPLGGVNVAGLGNLGIDGGEPGKLAIVENENRGSIATTISSSVGGGNVAQLVAGSDPAARFDKTAYTVSDNIGTGDVSRVEILNHPGWDFGVLPVVNLAAEASRQSDDEYYKHFVEGTNSAAKPIDPYFLTARMSGAYYQAGVTNEAGLINDLITASMPGDIVTVPYSCEIWSPIELDRAIILNLDNKVLDMVFDDYALKVTNEDADKALVKDGTIVHPEGKLATEKEGDGWTMSNVNTFSWNTNYWDRGIFIDGEFIDSFVALSAMLPYASTIAPTEDSGFSVDTESNSLLYNGKKAFSLAPLGCKLTDNGDGSYTIELDDDPLTAPEVSLSLAPNGGTSTVVVKGAKANCEYCLQSVTSLAENWDKVTDEWVSVENDGEELVFEIDTSAASGFYRIKIRKK